jgi:hypothetical protein
VYLHEQEAFVSGRELGVRKAERLEDVLVGPHGVVVDFHISQVKIQQLEEQ